MDDRAGHRQQFLEGAGWAQSRVEPLAGDASARRYFRAHRNGQNAIVMDSPPGASDTRAFLAVAAHLREAGFSAPEIYADDQTHGFILMEDFGDTVFASGIAGGDLDVETAYSVAVDVLLALRGAAVPERLRPYGPTEMAEAIAPLFQDYCIAAPSDAVEEISAELETVLSKAAPSADTMILRDYHAENLIWLGSRAGIRRAGLLDFQDAMQGHEIYDLASLLRDARRDVPEQCVRHQQARFRDASGWSTDGFGAAFAALSLQRNLRILGIFARLSHQQGKRRYLELLPRVWGYVIADLDHPSLTRLRAPLLAVVPAPEAGHIAWLARA